MSILWPKLDKWSMAGRRLGDRPRPAGPLGRPDRGSRATSAAPGQLPRLPGRATSAAPRQLPRLPGNFRKYTATSAGARPLGAPGGSRRGSSRWIRPPGRGASGRWRSSDPSRSIIAAVIFFLLSRYFAVSGRFASRDLEDVLCQGKLSPCYPWLLPGNPSEQIRSSRPFGVLVLDTTQPGRHTTP
jgi:hypothetical protein